MRNNPGQNHENNTMMIVVTTVQDIVIMITIRDMLVVVMDEGEDLVVEVDVVMVVGFMKDVRLMKMMPKH